MFILTHVCSPVFTKLASQLNADKLADLAIIPVIFIIQTIVSWTVATVVAKLFRFNRRAANFVTAMGVFGNSNSLPISLVLSLSQTIQGLHWDRIPGDNDDEVAARGILYLLIFQQLGQLVRWSWGYHVLLAPKERYVEYNDERAEEGNYRDEEPSPQDTAPLLEGLDGDAEENDASDADGKSVDSREYEPAGRTPVGCTSRASEYGSTDDEGLGTKKKRRTNGVTVPTESDDLLEFPHIADRHQENPKTGLARVFQKVKDTANQAKASVVAFASSCYGTLPRPVQVFLGYVSRASAKFGTFVWEFMNPPLWSMLIAVLVASIPGLQRLFFEEGSFVRNSVTRAVESNGGVAVPLILVVLGANLARNTVSRADNFDPEEEEIGTKLLVASLLSRMVLPTVIMAPILAVIAKYLPISILDDPIFVVVCFLLTGAPSALQLAQICQINNVYEKTMSRLLFQSYVIW